MKRIMLTVAYDGTNYHGWQIQPNGETIEGVLNRCLSELMQENIEVIGASRTDSGVHAMGNIAVFDTQSLIPPEKIAYALNARLPEDIKIQDSKEVDINFHPRHCDSRKTYEYRIYNATFPMPTKRLYSYFTYVPLDVERMREAASYFVGTHDFKSFCSVDSQVENTVRRIESVEVLKSDNQIVIRVVGRGFLYNMVRIMAGTLMEAGRGNILPHDIKRILEAKDRAAAGPTAPACGLTLMRYEFL
ncbi:MAG: tRNA pseudouridine(38-40) synthase TruA [Lachnospiraceae bacterium]|nr:tRNA pseudouridine(38-40) synthase TruA [Lachnospiraceae bacterium]